MTPLDTTANLHIFQRLQREERALWDTLKDAPLPEDDPLAAYRQREAFRERRLDIRRAVRREFDLEESGLRSIEVEGLLHGWPLENV